MSDRQPTRSKRENVDPNREFDKTSLRATAHGKWVHRDYAAHFFRWGFAGRFSNRETDILDVGCGPDCQLVEVLTMPLSSVPRSYVGVDMNKEPRKHPTRGWAQFLWEFNFLKDHKKLNGQKFGLITNFEVIEHMRAEDGQKLLIAMREHLAVGGKILLSTPVFSGNAAANHLHEWTIEELTRAIGKAKLRVAERYGTFGTWNKLKKAATPAEVDIAKRLAKYYSGEVISCFLAPLYPDAASNNIWVIEHA